jgi:polyhydroxyalkanoate synthase
VTGLNHLLDDLKQSCISITNTSAFEVGESVTLFEAAVVFKNDPFRSIQYLPLTTTVAQQPLVVGPPCINKFYILDL